jgi:ABC-2 type transport system permease protein
VSGRRAITLVARREIRERLRGKAFLVSTALLLALVGASVGLAHMVNVEKTYRVAVTKPVPPGLAAALQRAAKPFDDAKVRVHVVATPAAGRQALDAKKVDALLLLSADRLVFRSDVDAKAAAVADTAVRALRNQLPPAPELTTSALHPATKQSTDAEVLVAYAAAFLLLGALAVYGQWVVAGVVEEKNNRVVELILATTQPRHLLAGKVIGIGLLGLAQLGLVAGLATALLVAGAFEAPASLGGSLALVIPWFALGFALYAPPASRTRRQPDSRSPTPSSQRSSPATSCCPPMRRACSRTSSRCSRRPHRSCFLHGARSSASRSGSTPWPWCSSSLRSTRSSASPAACTARASSTQARAWALAQPGGSHASAEAGASLSAAGERA